MAKDKERRLAEELYIRQKKTAREVAILVGVTEKTLGDWVKKFGWAERRSSAMSSIKSGTENINALINIYTDRAIQMEKEDEDLSGYSEKELADFRRDKAKEKVSLIDSIAKLNKTKENFEKEHRIPYNVYINVTEQIMGEMLAKMPSKTQGPILDFFEEHINEIALKYR